MGAVTATIGSIATTSSDATVALRAMISADGAIRTASSSAALRMRPAMDAAATTRVGSTSAERGTADGAATTAMAGAVTAHPTGAPTACRAIMRQADGAMAIAASTSAFRSTASCTTRITGSRIPIPIVFPRHMAPIAGSAITMTRCSSTSTADASWTRCTTSSGDQDGAWPGFEPWSRSARPAMRRRYRA